MIVHFMLIERGYHMLDKWFISGVIKNNELFWITEIGGHIMKMDLENHNIKYISYKDKSLEKILPHSAMVCADNGTIYAIVNGGEGLLIICEEESTYKYIRLGLEKKYLNMFAFAQKYNEELIIVPMFDSNLLRINIVTEEIKYETILSHGDNINDNEIIQYFAHCDIITEDIIWIFSYQTSEVIQYKFHTSEKEYYGLPNEIGKPRDVIAYNEKFYILNSIGDVYSWDLKSGKTEKVFVNPIRATEGGFSVLHIAQNKLWVFPSYENAIFVYNMESQEIKCFDQYPEDFAYCAPKEMGKYTYKIQDKSKCYFAMHAGNYILYVDQETGEGKWIDAHWPCEDDKLEYLLKMNEGKFLEPDITLETFIDYIATKGEEEKESKYGTGKKLWEKCKGM